jgi:cytochrome P450
MLPSEFNPRAPETVENPYPSYRAIREHAPVYQVPGAGFFIISRYADILSALNNKEGFSSRRLSGVRTTPPAEITEICAQGYPQVDTLFTNDPPARIRGALSCAA